MRRVIGVVILILSWLLFGVTMMGDPNPRMTAEQRQQHDRAIGRNMCFASLLAMGGMVCIVFPGRRKLAG